MSYFDLLRAQRRAGAPPGLAPRRWSRRQQASLDAGRCVKCDRRPAGDNSFLCPECESADTPADVRREIAAARRKTIDG